MNPKKMDTKLLIDTLIQAAHEAGYQACRTAGAGLASDERYHSAIRRREVLREELLRRCASTNVSVEMDMNTGTVIGAQIDRLG